MSVALRKGSLVIGSEPIVKIRIGDEPALAPVAVKVGGSPVLAARSDAGLVPQRWSGGIREVNPPGSVECRAEVLPGEGGGVFDAELQHREQVADRARISVVLLS